MKAKLIKTPENLYKLKFNNNNDMLLCATALLSSKNCDEIFKVIDVEKIVDRHTFGQRNHEWKAYIAGFNKAMELYQPTEIDVEIEMECDGVQTGLCSEDCDCNVFSKLDLEGCLILKKI
jgi:hypothetical protein